MDGAAGDPGRRSDHRDVLAAVSEGLTALPRDLQQPRCEFQGVDLAEPGRQERQGAPHPAAVVRRDPGPFPMADDGPPQYAAPIAAGDIEHGTEVVAERLET